MKTKILIVEDNYYKYFTTKQVIESQLKIKVDVVTADTRDDLFKHTAQSKANLLVYRPAGGVVELLKYLRERKINCRNAEIQMLIVPEMEPATWRLFEKATQKFRRNAVPAAAA